MWRGRALSANADAYEAVLRGKVLPELRGLAGYLGAHVLRRAEGEEVEFVTVTYFASEDAIRAFAGDDVEHAVVSEGARAVLSQFDERARHYDVAVEPGD
jgi:heme-degrading monooxygenase HmoA